MRHTLEYHRFLHVLDGYQYSRTFEQFGRDLKKVRHFNLRFDDGWAGQLMACEMAKEAGVKVVLGITTDFIGRPGYLTWEQVRYLSHDHELGNHSVRHEHLDGYTVCQIIDELQRASDVVRRETNVQVTKYLPTYNFVNDNVKEACRQLGLILPEREPVIMYDTTIL